MQQFSDLQTFIKKVKRITRVEELTPELLNEFIERIDVHAAIKINGQRYQAIDIHYNGVGLIKRLPPEEFEKRFQNGKFKKPKLIVEEIEEKEKTA